MTKVKEKNPLGAYWLLQSFERVQFKDMDLAIYMGSHKPRQEGTKHMEEVQNDPDAFLPKMDVSVFTFYNTGESFPVYARSMASIVAGITLLHDSMFPGKRPLTIQSEFLLKLWSKSRNDTGYIEFDPNKTKYAYICKQAERHGTPVIKYDLNEPLRRVKNILWLKGSQVVMKRPMRSKKNEFIIDMLVVGKDIKRDEIVLGMKKTYKNYTRIVPLHNNGLNFVTSIRFMSVNRPSKYPVIIPSRLERLVKDHMEAMKDMDLAYVDFTLKVPKILEILESDA